MGGALDTRLSDTSIASEGDVVTAGERARHLARAMGFPREHATRIATAVFEIAKNVLRHAGHGRVELIQSDDAPRQLVARVTDTGPGLQALPGSDAPLPRDGAPGISGARQLMDTLDIASEPGGGTRVIMTKDLPRDAPDPPPAAALRAALAVASADDPYAELLRRNDTLIQLLTELDAQRRELAAANAGLKRAAEEHGRLLGQERIARAAAESAQREAVRAVASRQEILHVVSHDLRSPLNTLQLGASLLSRMANDGLDPERVGRIAATASVACRRMDRLIRDLLDFGAMERGQLGLNLAPTDVVAVIDEVVAEMQPIADEAGVALVTASPPAPLLLDCDRDRIVQVLENLVGNAVRFTPERGQVKLTLSRDEREVRFQVIDEGPGIPDDELRHIFDRYYTGEAVGPRGLGLGLAISLGLVRAHNGALWAESASGVGSTFVFTLPHDVPEHDTVEIPAIGADPRPR